MAFRPEEVGNLVDILSKPKFDEGKFIEEVFNGDYILVIGREVILEKSVEPSGDVNEYILRHVNNIRGKKYKDFNDVELHSNERLDPIRNLLSLKQFRDSMVIEDIATELRGLISLKLFKIVISTTFDCYLEILMRSIWGDKLRMVNICDDRSLAEFRDVLKSYRKGEPYNTPTLIYAFGKVIEDDESKMFARTDADLIQIIEKWMSFDKSDYILNFIQSKRLLALGCRFDDWYFRFFWYILKRDFSKLGEGEVAISLDVADRSENKLREFLYRTRVYNHEDARGFMEKITALLSPENADSPYLHQLIKKRRHKGGIFISYCSKDIVMASQLFFMLCKRFDNVWFDNASLYGGDKYNYEIEQAIGKAQVFIPILSPQIALDMQANHTENYYNKEWKMAVQRRENLSIIPLAINGYDLKSRYHVEIFEKMIGDSISGINLMETDGFDKLVSSIDRHLRL